MVADVSRYEFEIRAAGAEAQPELAVREALRHYLKETVEDYELAERALDRLLSLHPNSYVAFMVRGKIAQARNDSASARINFRRAESILSADQDNLLTAYKSRAERNRLLSEVRAQVANQQ